MTRRTSKRTNERVAPAEPKLLSGGNPQIAKGDVGRRLDALVVRTVPHVRKAVRWNSPFYGVEGWGWFLSFHCLTKYVKVTFLNGASLRPVPPLEGKHPAARFLHVHEGDELDEALLASWFLQAADLTGDELF